MTGNEVRGRIAERSLMVSVARRFYLDDRSKTQIADEFAISRFKVARLLELARETGLVTISIDDEGAILPELSATFAEVTGLSEVTVVESSTDPDESRRLVAAAAAELLATTLHPGEVLGISWGRTLSAMSRTLTDLPDVSVVQLTGTVGTDLAQSPVEIVRRLAGRSGGSAHPIFAPLIVGSEDVARSLRTQPDVSGALALFGQVTTAMLAVGSWDPLDSQLALATDPDERASLVARGVVGEMAATLFAADGSVMAPDYSARSIAIDHDRLRDINRVIVVAAGAAKSTALDAVIRSGIPSGAVIDRTLAEAVLDRRQAN